MKGKFSRTNIQKIFISETGRGMNLTLHTGLGHKPLYIFFSAWITLVAMATYSSHRLMMQRWKWTVSVRCFIGDACI